MPPSDLNHLIEPVARKLFGEPNLRYSRGDDLCFGALGMFVINTKTGRWFDREHGRGGEVHGLLRERCGCVSEQEYLEWLRGAGLLEDGAPPVAPGGGGNSS